MDEFARANDLATQILEVGPEQRRIKRMFVAIDANDKEMVNKYLHEFNLENVDNPVLALEFGFEVEGQYVTGVLRTSPDPEAPIYRWGKKDLSRAEWEKEWMVKGGFNRHPERMQNPVWGYSHLIGIAPEEAANVKYYLDNPAERALCKSDNCVAWTSSIELGKTARDLAGPERKHLMNELGVSRSTAHYEIGRRFMHAANQRNSAVVVFVNGDEGMNAFKTALRTHLPPEPQVPYSSIIKSIGYDPNGDLMQAMGKLPDGARIYFPIAAGASPEGMSGLIQQAKNMDKGFDVTILVNGISESSLRKGAELEGGKIRYQAHFIGGNMRKLHKEGKVAYIPGYLSDFPRFIKDPDMPEFNYDAIVVRVSPADEAGNHSLGPNHDTIMTILETQPDLKIIAEVNENIPFTVGDNIIPAARITASFKSTSQLAGPPVVPLTPVEDHIGKHIGELIDSGAVLQVGIGNIFGGLSKGMEEAGKRNITISTEMFGDPLKELLEKGIADKAETGFAYGSQDLYKWLHKNQQVQFVDTLSVNSPGRVENTPNFHAVNTALQVKLTGEVNAEMGPTGRISSPGGQVEFMSGAARSENGKSIIAIRSTAKNGTFSTISTELYNGHVTTPAESVHYVVTEYGIARLKGKDTWQRAVELINVAHPKFREALKNEAVEKGVISAEQASKVILNVPEIADVVPNHPGRNIASESKDFLFSLWDGIMSFFRGFAF